MTKKRKRALPLALVLGILWLGGCGASEGSPSMPLISPKAPDTSTPTPPAATKAPAPPTAVPGLLPGDKIGEMVIETSPSQSPVLWDYCPMAWTDQPDPEPVDCSMPWQAEVEIWQAWGAKDQALLDAGWPALTWEMTVDGLAIDLPAFGTWDLDWEVDGTPVKIRAWDIKLVNPTPGEHRLHYVLRTDRDVDNGFAVQPAGTMHLVLDVTVEAPEEGAAAARQAGPPPTFEESWWHETVFYEVFVRSFADSTTGPLAGDGTGDLQGLIERLDYLNDGDPATTEDLGVNGLWLMPVMQSPSYHGYDVTDYYAVDEAYGTLDDFRRLVAEAHARGMRVIVDLVLNHTSSEHPWFVEARDHPESERRGWYLWSEERPDYLGPWGQEVWHASPSGYYYGLFWSGMPDLNLANPAVTVEMEDVARFWLEEAGADGFRLDAARHLIEEGSTQENTAATHEWLRGFRRVYKGADPEALVVGEMWTQGPNVVEYLQGDELDLAFDFDLAEAIVKYVGLRTADRLQGTLGASYGLYGGGHAATFLTNHDMDRVMSELGDAGKAKVAASVLLTVPGVPFVYYGEEIGMTGEKPDEMIRTPMQWSAEESAGFSAGTPWEPVNSDYAEVNVAAQLQDPASLLSHYRALIRLRRENPALQVGSYHPVDCTDAGLLAFLRARGGGAVLVVVNLREGAARGYSLSLGEGPLSGVYRAAVLYGASAALPDLSANEAGGFDAYQALPEVPGNGTLVIGLQP